MSKVSEKVESFLIEKGLKLDGVYENNSTVYNWYCINGCHFQATWRTLQKKGACLICSNKRKLSFEQVKEYLESIGTTLLTKKEDYKNSYDQKIDLLCSKGHTTQKTFKAYRKHGCSICNPKDEKYDINDLKKIAAERGDTLISTEYVNAQTPLIFKCSNPSHEPYESLWTTYNRDNIRKGGYIEKTQCKKCAYEKLRTNFSFVKSEIEKENYRVLAEDSKIYSQSHILVQCDKQHDPYYTTWNRWSNGQERCPQCAYNAIKTNEEVSNILAQHGLTMANDYNYTGNKNPIKAICKKNHTTWKTLQGFIRYGCSECSTIGTSSVEFWLLDFFKHKNPIHRYRIKIPATLVAYEKYIEVDLFFPDEKIAIEYCGLYWHSSKRIESLYYDDLHELHWQLHKNTYRHQYKRAICNHLGITLITIFEDEFLNKKDIVLSRIEHKLGISKKIYGRECIVSEIEKDKANTFLKAYHLQEASPNFEYGIQLSYNGETVAVMTFASPLSKNNQQTLELKRYCSTPGLSIIGGFQKLFKYALQAIQIKNVNSIISYCDLRWGDGDVYKNAGFELIKTTNPSPHVVKGITRIRSRHIENKNLIYDCGHQKWLYKISTTF